MDIGIGLPAAISGTCGATILEWARRADDGPFSSLGISDRVVYPNYDPLIALAAAAGVTRRLRLMTAVLVAPLRDAALLAKQAASLDALSGGRLTLGLGIGGREDDFKAMSIPFHERGRRFEQQLPVMKRIWSGQPMRDDVGPIGPTPARPGGPELLIGGYAPAALQRVARWADGFISGDADADSARQLYANVQEAWKAGGRPGQPRFVAVTYWGLGPDAAEHVDRYLRHYYALSREHDIRYPTTPEAIRDVIQAYAEVGANELILLPCIPHPSQVERLARVVSRYSSS